MYQIVNRTSLRAAQPGLERTAGSMLRIRLQTWAGKHSPPTCQAHCGHWHRRLNDTVSPGASSGKNCSCCPGKFFFFFSLHFLTTLILNSKSGVGSYDWQSLIFTAISYLQGRQGKQVSGIFLICDGRQTSVDVDFRFCVSPKLTHTNVCIHNKYF